MGGRRRRLGRMVRRLGEVSLWRFIFGTALLALGLLAILIELEFPDFWTVTDEEGTTVKKPWAPWLAKGGAAVAVLAAAAGPVQGGLGLVGSNEELDRRRIQERLQELAQILFTMVAKERPTMDWKELTVRLYCVDRSGKEDRLRYVAESRHHDRPTSGVVWVKGKGCVGLAWSTGLATTINLDRQARKDALESKETWRAAPSEMRQELSYEEAIHVQSQGYGAVAAHPVRTDDDGVVGVIAIDSPAGHYEYIRSSDEVIRAVNMHIRLARDDIRALWESYR